MQQNMLRWFYQAYVNRLGAHLIELLSGRLAIGADQYRRLTRQVACPGARPEPTTYHRSLIIAWRARRSRASRG